MSDPIPLPSGSKVSLLPSPHLCTLTRITPSSTKEEEGQGDILAPVGRSYNGHAWENVAGPYQTILKFDCDNKNNNNNNRCIVDLPPLPSSEDEKQSYFVLTTFVHSISPIHEFSRFLIQATFGPTRSDLATLSNNNSNNNNPNVTTFIAQWIQNQMSSTTTKPTYHREYFRKRANMRVRLGGNFFMGKADHPCKRSNTRWRSYAFTRHDSRRWLRITTLQNSDDGKTPYYLLSVDNIARTIVSTIEFYDPSRYMLNVNRRYEICWRPMESISGTVRLRTDEDRSCRAIRNGNPKIDFVHLSQFRSAILNRAASIVSLPGPNQLRPLNNNNNNASPSEEYQLINPLDTNQCSNTVVRSSKAVFGQMPSGQFLLHDTHMLLENNTSPMPLSDGGGATVLETAGRTRCANVPRTIMNEGQCHLSYDPNACGIRTIADDTTFTLNHDTIRSIYQATGRYIYTIDGLRTDDDSLFHRGPCRPGRLSRWMPIGTQCDDAAATVSIHPTTNSVLSKLLSTSGDKNPYVRDIYFPGGGATACHSTDIENDVRGMQIEAAGKCWLNVPIDLLSVYDMTIWTKSDTHPGNAVPPTAGFGGVGSWRNPITKFAEDGLSVLYFPQHHNMDQWFRNKLRFTYIGRLGDHMTFRDLPDLLRTDAVAASLGAEETSTSGIGVVVCGSPGEVANEPDLLAGFDVALGPANNVISGTELIKQKKTAWNTIALTSSDQLRQRVAWALSQILVISPSGVFTNTNTETWLTHYDIFVRNAFGNYRDVLREIIYSPLMAEMLTYYRSKSSSYIWETERKIAYADENFAREVMQLFSTGLIKLHMDGTPELDDNGREILVYTNDDILAYAKAYTGFVTHERRGNTEDHDSQANRIDPLKIVPEWRDVSPKMGLNGIYVGDGYPLCMDEPARRFLRKGARYRLLGSSTMPEMQKDPSSFATNDKLKRLQLDPSSSLFAALCNATSSGKCTYPSEVILSETLPCHKVECKLDTIRIANVETSIHYEYVRPACVEQPFYNKGKRVSDSTDETIMCADRRRDVASTSCCSSGTKWAASVCQYAGERNLYATAFDRCITTMRGNCKFKKIHYNTEPCDVSDRFFWTSYICNPSIKVSPSGTVAIVHEPMYNTDNSKIPAHVRVDNRNYFRVHWKDGMIPSLTRNNCANGLFEIMDDGNCKCDVQVVDEVVFTSMPTRQQILDQLHIGSFPPDLFDSGVYTKRNVGNKKDVEVYSRSGRSTWFDMDTIFVVKNADLGRTLFLKNVVSTVQLLKSSTGMEVTEFSFRNPPRFYSDVDPEVRDAYHEMEAVIDHYIYHKNTAPFLAIRFIQRFGISNPSPRYVKTVATAFATGTYTYVDSDNNVSISFGSGKNADLAATFAALLLDREARDPLLDADPAHGSLREPLLKILHFFRSMELDPKYRVNQLKLMDLQISIGQESHSHPSVFNFYLPDYAPNGPVSHASLVAPEAQIMHMASTVRLMNGFFSAIKFGLTGCHYGFGPSENPSLSCSWLPEGDTRKSIGEFQYTPTTITNADAVVEELSTLLTPGRLADSHKQIISSFYAKEMSQRQPPDPAAALRKAQQLMVSTAQFHTSNNIVRTTNELRGESTLPPNQCKPSYKALVYLFLGGGCDSYSMLIPHSNCATKDMYKEYEEERDYLALERDTLLTIDATGSDQPCDTFGLHPRLSTVQNLYNNGELLFLANQGVLNTPVTKEDYLDKTKTRLFAHDAMQGETNRLNPFDTIAGTGLCGRLVDILKNEQNLNVGSFSIDSTSAALVGASSSQIVLSRDGVIEYDPRPTPGVNEAIEKLNAKTSTQSGLFGETWSSMLTSSIEQNRQLYEAEQMSNVETAFPGTAIGLQLETVSRIIKARKCQGVDRDVFFVRMGGYDTHGYNNEGTDRNFSYLNPALAAFTAEMKAQGQWDNVVLLQMSEFGRTLSPNSGFGTDHGWGGHHFMMGGAVKGGRILGQYPSDLTDANPLNVGRGRFIPTKPCEAVWNGVAQWFGTKSERELDAILPNRHWFLNDLFQAKDLFVLPNAEFPTPSPVSPVPSKKPTRVPTPSPTSSPSLRPSTSPSIEILPPSPAPSSAPTLDRPSPKPTFAPTISTKPTAAPQTPPTPFPTTLKPTGSGDDDDEDSSTTLQPATMQPTSLQPTSLSPTTTIPTTKPTLSPFTITTPTPTFSDGDGGTTISNEEGTNNDRFFGDEFMRDVFENEWLYRSLILVGAVIVLLISILILRRGWKRYGPYGRI